MKKSFAVVLTVVALIFLLAAAAFSADKLIVKDSGGTNTVFSVSDTGEVFAGGTDANNAFQIQVMGHTGGASHVQLVTNQTNSRISLIGSSATDFAPRWQAIGPQDPSNPGWEIFDFGSNLFNLPSATFKIRHYNMTGPQDMISIAGRSSVLFPSGKVGVGTGTSTLHHLFNVGTNGAGSDGATWFTSSSRRIQRQYSRT